MRILLASRNFFPQGVVGGAQLSMMLLGQALQKQGHEIAVLSVDDEAHEGLHTASGLMEYRLKLKNLYTRGNHSAAKKLLWHGIDRFTRVMEGDYAKAIAAFRPDVINTNVLAAMGVGVWNAAHKAGVPIIHTIHDYYLICIKSGMRSKGQNCASACVSCGFAALGPSLLPSRKVSEVIYVSRHMQRAHEKAGLFGPQTGASIIHGSYAPATPPAPRAGLLNPPVLTLGFFGRISPEKGLDKLLAAVKTLPQGSWRLLVGGGGEADYVRKMQALAEGLPVTFLGIVTPDSFYSSVDAVIISSLWNDPAPRVAYEAGIHGVVPIVAARGGLPELVDEGGRGLIFEPDDAASLPAAIAQLAADMSMLPRFQAEWQKVAPIFLPEYVARQTVDIYERARSSAAQAAA